MKKVIKKVLNNINKAGYEAFIVGGFVRDYLMGIKSYDIDICTNATPEVLMAIFPLANFNNIGGVTFFCKKYNFEITTYREELQYENRKPVRINFISDLQLDLQRRDFTINTMIMNKKGTITDYLNGKTDLKNKQIVVVGNIETKLKEDPLRILRAIRFATILNFELEPKLTKFIIENTSLILTLSSTRIREELDKILLSKNAMYGLDLLKNTGILQVLQITYDKIIPVSNIEGIYAQFNIKNDLPFTKKEKGKINLLKEILKENEINYETVYKYGLELTLIAGEIKGLNNKTIKKMYKQLPLKNIKDIKITFQEIQNVLNVENKEIGKIIAELEILIINGKIKNTKKSIIKYLKSR